MSKKTSIVSDERLGLDQNRVVPSGLEAQTNNLEVVFHRRFGTTDRFCRTAYVGDGVDVGAGQAEMPDHLQAPVFSRQVERSPAVLHRTHNTTTTQPFRLGVCICKSLAIRHASRYSTRTHFLSFFFIYDLEHSNFNKMVKISLINDHNVKLHLYFIHKLLLPKKFIVLLFW